MKKTLLILYVLVISFASFGQTFPVVPRANSSYTVEDSRFSAKYNLFVPKYADTIAANAGTSEGNDSLGAVIFNYATMSLWVRSGSPKTWVEIGTGGGGGSGTVTNIATGLGLSGGPITTTGTILVDTASASILSRQRAAATYQLLNSYTASRGINLAAADFRLGGSLDSTVDITYNNNILKFRKSVPDGDFGSINFTTLDTISGTDAFGLKDGSGFFHRRVLQIPSYNTNLTYKVGSNLSLSFEIKDSAFIQTWGGDFGIAHKSNMLLRKMAGYSGRSVYMGGPTYNEAPSVQLSDMVIGNPASTTGDYRYARNWWAGHSSFLYVGTKDTIEKFMGNVSAGAFFGTGYADYTFDFFGGHLGAHSVNTVKNPWFLYGFTPRSKSFIAGPIGLGDSTIEASSQMDISSTTKGVLFPRMTAAQRLAISSPATGLAVFDTDSASHFQYTGSAWQNIRSSGGGATAFTGLSDVPSSYAGQALKVVSVNAGETGLVFTTLAGGGDALTANPLSQFASTTSAQLAGVISDEVGTDKLVYNTSPLFVTPRLNATSTTGFIWTATDAIGNGSFQAAPGGIATLNTLSGATQTFATGTTGTDFGISSSGTTHTFNIPDASASNRGLVTTGAQVLAGIKNLTSLSNFSGGFASNSTLATSNIYVVGGGAATRSTEAAYLVESAAGTGFRVGQKGNTGYTMTANDMYSSQIIGTGALTEAATGTHPLLSTLVLRAPTVTNGAGATAAMATLYIDAAPSGVTPTGRTSSIWVKAGETILGGALSVPTTSTSADITLDITHYTMRVDASGAARTITLPSAAGCTGRKYVIKKTDSSVNTVTIDGNASETIDGTTTKVISTQYAGYMIQSDGTNFIIIGAF